MNPLTNIKNSSEETVMKSSLPWRKPQIIFMKKELGLQVRMWIVSVTQIASMRGLSKYKIILHNDPALLYPYQPNVQYFTSL